VAIFLFLTNIAGLINIYNSSSPSLSTSDNEQIQKLKQQQWAYEIQIRYLEAIDDGCLLTYHLPTERSAEIIHAQIDLHKDRKEISSFLNPYPGHTKIYEIGTVTSVDSKEIDTSNSRVRIYRIELNYNPYIFVEYISDKDNPNLYVVKNEKNSNFLLYPIMLKYVNNTAYISLIN